MFTVEVQCSCSRTRAVISEIWPQKIHPQDTGNNAKKTLKAKSRLQYSTQKREREKKENSAKGQKNSRFFGETSMSPAKALFFLKPKHLTKLLY